MLQVLRFFDAAKVIDPLYDGPLKPESIIVNALLSIVHMIPSLTKGGAERVVVDLANASFRDGHKVTVVAGQRANEQILRVSLHPAVRVIYITRTAGCKPLQYLAGLYWVLKNRAWLINQDVLHVHLTQMAVLGTILYAIRALSSSRGPAIVETYHAVGMKITYSMRAFHSLNCKWRDAIAFIALDSFWRRFIARNPSMLSELIPNGIDASLGEVSADDVRAYLDEVGIPKHAKRIVGTVGQFRRDREPLTVARIMIDVLKQAPSDVHVLMCGSGPELKRVRALVIEHGLSERFTLPGPVNNPQVAMSAMSLYLTVVVGEIAGIAALEAAFCGTALVGLQMLSNQQDSENSWIWSSSDPACVARKIIEFLAEPEKTLEVSRLQYAYVTKNHEIAHAHACYVTLYNRAIKSRRDQTALR